MKPVVTYVLLSYNQEKYIRDAIDSALCQTYSPLQIIISDDCSTDDTYEIIREMTQNYHGQHELIVNRNGTNMGLCQHVNKIMLFAKGELIVAAAGDDISVPYRVQVLAAEWLSRGRPAISLHSSVVLVDDNNHELAIYKKKQAHGSEPEIAALNTIIIGAAHAWSRRVWDVFGDIEANIMSEDNVIAFRSALLDGIVFTAQPLVYYRKGGYSDIATKATWHEREIRERYYKWRIEICDQHLRDLMKTQKKNRAILCKRIKKRIQNDKALLKLVTSQNNSFSLLCKQPNLISYYLIKHILSYKYPYLVKYKNEIFNIKKLLGS